MRKILGVFKTAPILAMEVESALPPPTVRLNAALRRYAFRLLKLSPTHPINAAIANIHNPTEVLPRERTKTPLQLCRIYDSIAELHEGADLEQIKHYYFGPWNLDTFYDVQISSLPKEEEAKNHLEAVKNNLHNNIFIYTDASSMEKSTGIGVAIATFSLPSTTLHYQKLANLGKNQLVYNSELEGTTTAIEYASRQAKPGLHYHVYSDNQAGIWRLKTPSDNPGQDCQIRAIKAAKIITQKQAKVTIHWAPGHEDI
jgi:hypothetical protein